MHHARAAKENQSSQQAKNENNIVSIQSQRILVKVHPVYKSNSSARNVVSINIVSVQSQRILVRVNRVYQSNSSASNVMRSTLRALQKPICWLSNVCQSKVGIAGVSWQESVNQRLQRSLVSHHVSHCNFLANEKMQSDGWL